MKLGLLVVLAVAVLVPSLSEGRIVSRCELKDKLGEAIVLPKKLHKFKEQILNIGEVNKRWVCVSWGSEKSDHDLQSHQYKFSIFQLQRQTAD